MIMVDHEEDTNTWTKEYVTSNRKVCLLYLREVNLLTVGYIKEGKNYAASVCLEQLLNGFLIMHSSKEYGDLRSYLSIYSCSEAELFAFADPAGMLDELKGFGQTELTLSQFSEKLRDMAVAGFEDARDFARSDDLKQTTASMAKDLKAGISTDQVRRDYAPDFPEEVWENLLEMDSRFFVPELCRCAPDECLYLDKERLLFTNDLDPQAALSLSSKSSSVSSTGKRGKKNFQDFDEWMRESDLSEADLEWIYKRVKFRRNLYGILLLIPPLGPVLLPFWIRAVYLTKALYYRDLGVDFSLFQKLVYLFYGFPSLYIYPIVMGLIIRSTDWGMGLRSKSARVLSITVLLIFVFALIYTLASEGMLHEMAGKASELPEKVTAIFRRPAEDTAMDAASQEADRVYQETMPEPTPAQIPEATPVPIPELLSFEDYTGSLDNYSQVAFSSACASSEIFFNGMNFSAGKAIDGNWKTSWQENADGDGIGEYLILSFEEEQQIDLLCLRLGFSTYYEVNGRPSELEFEFSDGTVLQHSFPDENRDFFIKLNRSAITSYIKITILDVYTGSEWQDTCITEVEAYGETS